MSQKLLENSHKVTFLIKQYPEHDLPDILKLLGMPAIEINTALWYAQDQGLITLPGDNKVDFVKAPENWVFGDSVETLMDLVLYAFQKNGQDERDLDEEYLSNWTLGYNPQDVMIALNTLINNGQLTTYTLADPDDLASVYTFYTLPENKDKVWGRKSFKKEPVQEKDMPTNDDSDKAGEEPTNE